MKRSIALAAVVMAALLVAVTDADARRLGGGRSFGSQRSITPAPSVTAPSTPGAAANPVMPAQPGASMARPAAPAAVAPRAGMSRWLGPIAGIAAGLGLAALMSHFGLSEGFGSLLLIMLVVGGGLLLIRALMARRAGPAAGPMRYSPAAATPATAPVQPAAGTTPRFEPAWGAGTSATPTGARRYPPGFEPAPFVAEAKRQFTKLQQAYDRGDRAALAEVLTPAMQVEIGRELDERGEQVPTEVVSLNADVLEVATEGGQHWASVRFTGLTREDGKAQPESFDEVWNLTKPVDGSTGWRLAGIQQYA